MAIYPGIEPAPRAAGMRLAAILRIQSLVWNNDDQQILLDLDIAIQRTGSRHSLSASFTSS
jgi:predicted 2-oxoglutarate/Fe(II)-dependent dioxygenase YbiX